MYVAVHFYKLICYEHSQILRARCERFTSNNQSENRSSHVYHFRIQLHPKLARQFFDNSRVLPFLGRHSSDFAIYDFLNAFHFGQLEPLFVSQHV